MTQWKAGESGNPNGRPRGTGEVQKLRARLGEHLHELLDRVMLQALSGDLTAARLILDRVVPTLKPDSLPIYLPDFSPSSPLVIQGKRILAAIAAGDVAPDVGGQLMAGVAALAGLKSSDEFEAELRAMESGDGFSDLA